MSDSGLPSHLSESGEHFTPPHVSAAARALQGGIDLDPFSCAEANAIVGATSYFGLDHPTPSCRNAWGRAWYGRLLVNPPGGRVDDQGRRVEKDCNLTGSCGIAHRHTHRGSGSAQKRAWFKLDAEYRAGRVKSAVFVCFNLGLLQATQVKTPAGASIPLDYPICYPANRLEYGTPGGGVGGQPPHASCLIWLPPRRPILAGEEAHAWWIEWAHKFTKEFNKIGRVVVPMRLFKGV